jgi:hypothetical protein
MAHRTHVLVRKPRGSRDANVLHDPKYIARILRQLVDDDGYEIREIIILARPEGWDPDDIDEISLTRA